MSSSSARSGGSGGLYTVHAVEPDPWARRGLTPQRVAVPLQ